MENQPNDSNERIDQNKIKQDFKLTWEFDDNGNFVPQVVETADVNYYEKDED